MSQQSQGRLFDEVVVSLPDARDLLAPYGIQEIAALAPLSGGIVNTNLRVDADGRQWLLRVYYPERRLEEIQFELSLLRHLDRRGFVCQAPLPTRTGKWIGRWNGRYYVVLRFLPGRPLTPEELSPEVSAQVGRRLAEFHHLVKGFVPEGARPREDVDELARATARTAHALRAAGYPVEAEQLERDWQAASAGDPFAALPLGVLHADVFPGNVIFQDDNLVGFVDFDDAYYGTQFHDLAIAALEFGTGPSQVPDPVLVQPLVRAYEGLGGPVDRELLVRGMWLNCFRFLSATLLVTLRAGQSPLANVEARRLVFYHDPAHRSALLQALRS